MLKYQDLSYSVYEGCLYLHTDMYQYSTYDVGELGGQIFITQSDFMRLYKHAQTLDSYGIDSIMNHQFVCGVGVAREFKVLANIKLRPDFDPRSFFLGLGQIGCSKRAKEGRAHGPWQERKVLEEREDTVRVITKQKRFVPQKVSSPRAVRNFTPINNIAEYCASITDVIKGTDDKVENKRELGIYLARESAANYYRQYTTQRTYDVANILRNIDFNFACFPGDGVGVGAAVCRHMRKRSISGDISPFAIEYARKLGNHTDDFKVEDAVDTVIRGVKMGCDLIVISHLLAIKPFLLEYVLTTGILVVVYEHETVYRGMENLVEPIMGFRHIRCSPFLVWKNVSTEFSLMSRVSEYTSVLTDYFNPAETYLVTEGSVLSHISFLVKTFKLSLKFRFVQSGKEVDDGVLLSMGLIPSASSVLTHIGNKEICLGAFPGGGFIAKSFNLQYNTFIDRKSVYSYEVGRKKWPYLSFIVAAGLVDPVHLSYNNTHLPGFFSIPGRDVEIINGSTLSNFTVKCEDVTGLESYKPPQIKIHSEYNGKYNLENSFIGYIPRSQVRFGVFGRGEQKYYVRSVHVLYWENIDNSGFDDKEVGVYLAIRSKSKTLLPGRFDFSAGGVVRYKESPNEAIRRECLEELGVVPNLTFLGLGEPKDEFMSFNYVYVVQGNPSVGSWNKEDIDSFELVTESNFASRLGKVGCKHDLEVTLRKLDIWNILKY